jgi:hypothetical protein
MPEKDNPEALKLHVEEQLTEIYDHVEDLYSLFYAQAVGAGIQAGEMRGIQFIVPEYGNIRIKHHYENENDEEKEEFGYSISIKVRPEEEEKSLIGKAEEHVNLLILRPTNLLKKDQIDTKVQKHGIWYRSHWGRSWKTQHATALSGSIDDLHSALIEYIPQKGVILKPNPLHRAGDKRHTKYKGVLVSLPYESADESSSI